MGGIVMKQFNLEEYLKNPSKEVVTRMGRKVRIICTDREDPIYTIVALIKDDKRESEILVSYTKDGIPAEYNEAYYTLFFAPENHEGWLNIYRNESRFYLRGNPYKSKEEAEEVAKANYKTFCTTVKIEWEE